jgi:hypothetical protein
MLPIENYQLPADSCLLNIFLPLNFFTFTLSPKVVVNLTPVFGFRFPFAALDFLLDFQQAWAAKIPTFLVEDIPAKNPLGFAKIAFVIDRF